MDELFYDSRIAGLIIQFLQEDISESEHQELQAWINSSPRAKEIFEELTSEEKLPDELAHFAESRKRVLAKIHAAEPETRVVVEMNRGFRWKPWLAAAVVIGLAVTGYWLAMKNTTETGMTIVKQDSALNDVAPGKDGAILTLSDGRKIVLEDTKDGDITNNVRKQGSKLVYANTNGSEVEYHLMTTPKGRTYRVDLSDGSVAYLNAASSLYYPQQFGNERRVEITGEVYFEVAKDASRKFIVVTKDVTTEVFGTSFNVNTYDDERESKVTLLEGSVQLKTASKSTMLRPGEQGSVLKQSATNEIKISSKVNVEQVMAWKNGLFKFQSTPMQEMMRQIARWYDVEVVYANDIKDDPVSGTIERNTNASTALAMLEYMGYKFKIEGKKVTVMND